MCAGSNPAGAPVPGAPLLSCGSSLPARKDGPETPATGCTYRTACGPATSILARLAEARRRHRPGRPGAGCQWERASASCSPNTVLLASLMAKSRSLTTPRRSHAHSSPVITRTVFMIMGLGRCSHTNLMIMNVILAAFQINEWAMAVQI